MPNWQRLRNTEKNMADRKLIIEANGRLGNHLNQIMAGISIAKDYDCELFINSRDRTWAYSDCFDDPIKTLDINTVAYNHIDVAPLEHCPLDLSYENNYLTGYFLNRKWHEHNRGYVIEKLKFDTALVAEARCWLESHAGRLGAGVCIIHVRRGDFLNTPCHFFVGDGYYKAVLKLLEDAGYTYLVCSDDPAWCSDFFKIHHHFSCARPVIDFLMMTMAQCNVIANSSFGYCAAYLNPASRVLYPCKWSDYFGEVDLGKMCPDDWTEIIY